jgi:(S)-mandelate dehydrogenase
MVFNYLDGAAGDETGLNVNRQALQRIVFAPRRLVNVATRETGITLFGRPYETPLIIAPMGLNGVFWPNGDIALARAAARAEIPFCLSTTARLPRASPGTCCF